MVGKEGMVFWGGEEDEKWAGKGKEGCAWDRVGKEVGIVGGDGGGGDVDSSSGGGEGEGEGRQEVKGEGEGTGVLKILISSKLSSFQE